MRRRKRGKKFRAGVVAVDDVKIPARGEKFSFGGAIIFKPAVRFNVLGRNVGQHGRFKTDEAVAVLHNALGAHFHHRVTTVLIRGAAQKFLQREPSGHCHPGAVFPNAVADPEFY